LSAAIDGELPSREQDAFAEHVDRCEACATLFRDFRELSVMAAALPMPSPDPDLWEKIEAERNGWRSLVSQRRGVPLPFTKVSAMRWGGIAIALALVGLALVGIQGRGGPRRGLRPHFTLNDLIEGPLHGSAETHPNGAVQFDRRDTGLAEAARLVGYQPLIADGLPEEYTLVSTTVLAAPGCTCVECACSRKDGTTLAIIEHEAVGDEWFGERPVTTCQCGETSCQVAEVGETLAATWRVGERSMTVVGARDRQELERLVAWFDDRRRKRAERSPGIDSQL
jgi:anti-sigma factor RsiW